MRKRRRRIRIKRSKMKMDLRRLVSKVFLASEQHGILKKCAIVR